MRTVTGPPARPAVLIVAQVVRALRLEVAARAGVDLFDVSLPLLLRYLPRFARDGQDPIAAIVATGGGAGLFRPARRVRIHASYLSPDLLAPAPPGLLLGRTPRYARKDCGPRSIKTATGEK